MRTYYFKAANWALGLLISYFSFLGGIFLLAFTLPKGLSNTIFFLSCGGVLVFCIYLARLTSFAKVQVTIGDDTVSIKWLEQFIFSNNIDVTISFSEIAAYYVIFYPIWDGFTIEMKDGSIYKIWHQFRFTKDDYSEFISAFVASVKKYNIVVKKSSGISPKFYRSSKKSAYK